MVTGATSGFGKAIAYIFAKNGYNIIITGRRNERLEELKKELLSFDKISVLPLNFDVRKQSDVESVIKNLPEEWKNIDILVNNAGLAVGMSHIDNGNIDDWDRMIDTNLKGTSVCHPGCVTNNGIEKQWSHLQYRINCRDRGIRERKCILCNKSCCCLSFQINAYRPFETQCQGY